MSGTLQSGHTDPTVAGWTVQNAFIPDWWTDGSIKAAVSLNAVTANGAGAVVDFGGARENIGIEVSTTGVPTAGTVTLLVSDDGTTWVTTTTTATVGSGVTSAMLTGVAWRYAQLSLSGLTGGTAPTVTGKVMAY